MATVFNSTARATLYAANGTGRDTYISFDNGGNTVKYEPNSLGVRLAPLVSPR